MGRALSMEVLPDLPDLALFVLVALNLHDELPEEEIAAVTNVAVGPVRTTIRDLSARGLLRPAAGGAWGIATGELPRVQRTLRRRHFLHDLGG
jgi:DNA-binding GntR family transcriptional regulator